MTLILKISKPKWLKDYLLERRISRLANRLKSAVDIQEKRQINSELMAEIKKRSPQQVARIEKAKGLL